MGGCGCHGHSDDKNIEIDHLSDFGLISAENSNSKEKKQKKEIDANIKAAIVHVIGDIVQSIGVIIAAVIILIWPEAKIIDPILTIVFAMIVCFTTKGVLKTCCAILMEATPKMNVSLEEIEKNLFNIYGVKEVHD